MLNGACAQWIAVDAMGSDKGPTEVIAGVAAALREYKHLRGVVVVGPEGELRPLLAAEKLEGHARVRLFHASEVVQMTDKPVQALKQKKDSSMVRALELVKAGEVRGMLSCGNTGALIAGGTLKLRPLKGIERPALAPLMPTQDHHFVLLDAGANPEASALQMAHQAILGSEYCRVVLRKPNPRVGLLTIGTEEGKGNEVTIEAHQYLRRMEGLINYSGLIEGFHVFENHVDVVVCDGHVGNILLKTCEGLYKALRKFVRDEVKKTPWRMAGIFLAQGAFKAMKQQLSPDNYGGAALLGLNGTVVKGHGSSNRLAIQTALRMCADLAAQDVSAHVLPLVEKANATLEAVDHSAPAAKAG